MVAKNHTGHGSKRLELLTVLVEEARREGGDIVRLVAIVEEASALGASKALRRCGLHDESAGEDVRELRQILSAWRDARRTAWRTSVKWVITILFALLLAGLASKFDLSLPD
jgi:Family of unknown function (DUF6127)